jgi:Aspartate/tyrosine/aromatic aminotransferase
MNVVSKLPDTGTTIFTIMSKLAHETGAINLSQGFPDYEVDQRLKELVSDAIHQGYNQYAPMTGIPELRDAIARKKNLLYDINLDPDQEITITNGATEALYSAISALVHPGEEVIIFEPAYDSYAPAITLNGGKVVPIKMYAPDYKIDWKLTANAINPSTRMIIINTPHNPTGSILTDADMQELSRLVEGTDIIILSDEVYQHLLYDDQSHCSMLRYPQLYPRCVVTMSFGKTFHATGWRIGYVIAPSSLSREIRKVHQFNTFSINRPLQHALAHYLEDAEHYLGLPKFFGDKRDLFIRSMKNSPFKLLPCKGTYFITADYSNISKEGDQDFARWMTRTVGVAVIPISSFYTDRTDDHIIRFCFAKKDATLLEASNRIVNFFN